MRQAMVVLVLGTVLGGGLVLGGCAKQRSLHAVRASGDKALAEGDTRRAITDFGEYVARAPERAEGHLGYGKALLAAGRYSEAVEQLWIARANMLTSEDAYEALVEALYRDGQYEPMYSALRERVVERGKVEDHLRLGHYAQKIGDDDQALRAFRTAARVDGGQNVAPQVALADFYRTVGNNQEALRRLRMAYYIDPDNEVVKQKIRLMGEIPGPTIRLKPEEQVETVGAPGPN